MGGDGSFTELQPSCQGRSREAGGRKGRVDGRRKGGILGRMKRRTRGAGNGFRTSWGADGQTGAMRHDIKVTVSV